LRPEHAEHVRLTLSLMNDPDERLPWMDRCCAQLNISESGCLSAVNCVGIDPVPIQIRGEAFRRGTAIIAGHEKTFVIGGPVSPLPPPQ
jgi:hypothetical protein